MTPEEVAASYGEDEDEAGNDPGTISPKPEDPAPALAPAAGRTPRQGCTEPRTEDVIPATPPGASAPSAS
jgi:hypothetical protein